MQLFDRVVELTVGETQISGLDIAFEIEKDESPAPNPCHIEIYNLSLANRAILSKYIHVPVTLKVGYKDNLGTIFKGDMIKCTHLKEGTSWKTVLASGDGALAIQTKRIDKSYSKGTPIKEVVADLAQKIGLAKASPLTHLKELDDLTARSFMVSGNPMAELSRILSGRNIQVSIQNQALQLRKISEPVQKEAIFLNSKSGLIESPEVGSKGELTVRALLMPELLPGHKVKIESAVFNGFATIKSVRFIGSNFGSEWDAEMSCSLPILIMRKTS